jgi:hypothetical protein
LPRSMAAFALRSATTCRSWLALAAIIGHPSDRRASSARACR